MAPGGADIPLGPGLSMRSALAAARQQKPLTLGKLFQLQMTLVEDARDPQLVMILEAIKAAVVEYVEEIKNEKERDEKQGIVNSSLGIISSPC